MLTAPLSTQTSRAQPQHRQFHSLFASLLLGSCSRVGLARGLSVALNRVARRNNVVTSMNHKARIRYLEEFEEAFMKS